MKANLRAERMDMQSRDQGTAERVLIVDDDDMILYSHQKLLEHDYVVHTASSGQEGLQRLAADGPFAVIVSDFQMPGMDGLKFLSRVREVYPDSVRVMMTSHSQLQTAIDAVNEGNVFRFLCKPCPENTFRSAVDASVAQYRLIVAEKELLEKTVSGSIKVLSEVLGLVNPLAYSISQSVTRYVQHVVSDLGLRNGWRLEAAALLSQLGCVTVDSETMDAIFAGKPVSKGERERFNRQHTVARELLGRIPRLEYVAELIGLQAEPWSTDNSASPMPSPDSTQFGAQILKTCSEFDRLMRRGLSLQAATNTLRKQSGNTNPVVESLGRLPSELLPFEVRQITADQLEPEMILDQDIRTTKGVLLVAKGVQVTELLRLRLQSFHAKKIVQGEIRILART